MLPTSIIWKTHTAHLLMLKHSLHIDRSRGDVGEASKMRGRVDVFEPGNILRCSPRETVTNPGKGHMGKGGRLSEKASDRSET